MKKLYIKKFEYLGQAVNYINKVWENPKVTSATKYYDTDSKCWIVTYQF